MGHGAEAPRDAKSVTKLRIEAYVMYRDNAIHNPSKQSNNVWLKLLGPIKKNYTWKENTTYTPKDNANRVSLLNAT